MSCVYVLRSTTGRHYIGSTVDIVKRLSRHKSHTATRTTKTGEWVLIALKECDSISSAREEEKRVKSFKGGNGLRDFIEKWRVG